MALFMIAAQGFHFKIKNTFIKYVPSFILLVLCAFIAFASYELDKKITSPLMGRLL